MKATSPSKDEIEEQSSPASATVYSDGVNGEIFYDWQTPQEPPTGQELAGTIYVVAEDAEKGWRTKARLTDEKWDTVMERAMTLFNKKLRETIGSLNQLGLGLPHLRALAAFLNKPGAAQELEKAFTKDFAKLDN